MNRQTEKLKPAEITEILASVRMAAERYDQHSKAAMRRDDTKSAAQWGRYAEDALKLYTKLTEADEFVICTFVE